MTGGAQERVGGAKLTPAQLRVLEEIAKRNGYYTAWTPGTSTSEALRKRGLVEGERPFTGRFRHDPILWITEAGRAALKARSES